MAKLTNQEAQDLLIEAVDLNNELTHDKQLHRVARSIAGLLYRTTMIPELMEETMSALNPDVAKDVLVSIKDTYDLSYVLIAQEDLIEQFIMNDKDGHSLPDPDVLKRLAVVLKDGLSEYDRETLASIILGEQ